MLSIDFLSRNDIVSTFPNEESCIKHLEQLRWKDGVISPFDKNSKVYLCKENKYRCRNSGKYFNVKTNTLFHNSRIPLQKWFIAIWMISSRKKGITSVDLAKELSLTQKTAWYMIQRIKTYTEADNGIVKTKGKPKAKKPSVVVKPKLVKPVEKQILQTKPIESLPKVEKQIERKVEKQIERVEAKEQENNKLSMSDWLLRLKKQ